MRRSAAARRYARALFSLAREERRVAEVREELAQLGSLLAENEELRETLLTPLHPASERKSVLAAIAERAGMGPLVRHFTSYLVDQRRLIQFDGIREEYERLADEASGLTTALVVSASPLDERRKDRLRRALSERTGSEVRLEVRVDPELLGGAIAKVGDTIFDGSLRTQLGRLRSNLMRGA
jgi:F-type H+-transporting ATPase subunit delta